jgi:hypothetical protein
VSLGPLILYGYQSKREWREATRMPESSLARNSHSLRFCPQLSLPIVDTDHDGTISLDEVEEAIKSDPLEEDTLDASNGAPS